MRLFLSLFVLIIFQPSYAQTQKKVSAHVSLRIEFAFAYSTVYYKDFKTVRNFAKIIKNYPQSNLKISGHTDWIGSEEINQELSEARAMTVKKMLIRYGIKKSRLSAKGYSEQYPIADNKTALGRAKNRRVVAIIEDLNEKEFKDLKKKLKKTSSLKLVKSVIQDSKNSQVAQQETATSPEKDDETVASIEKDPIDEIDDPIGEYESMEEENQTVSQVADDEFEEELPPWDDPEEEFKEIAQEPYEENSEEIAESPKRDIAQAIDIPEQEVSYKHKPERKHFLKAFFIPNLSSNYFEGDLNFEHGEFEVSGFGLNIDYKISSRLRLKGYAQYLPTVLREGTSGINFSGTDTIEYENNLYGIYGSYRLGKDSRFSLDLGMSSHIIGGIERLSALNYQFDKFNHMSALIGASYEMYLKSWKLDFALAYLLPLSVSEVDDFSGKLWFRGKVGVTRKISKRLFAELRYEVNYHDSEFVFTSGFQTRPEFLIHAYMLGISYNF